MIPTQALVGNVGTCRLDAKGEHRRSSPPKVKSTDARHRGGVTRNSGEVAERSRSEGVTSSGRTVRSTRKGRNR